MAHTSLNPTAQTTSAGVSINQTFTATKGSATSSGCITCHKTTPVLKCSACHTTQYCSKDCQKIDWKSHKMICNKQSTPRTSDKNPLPTQGKDPLPSQGKDPLPSQFRIPAPTPATSILNNILNNIPQKEVFRRLVDIFRLRVEDNYVYGGDLTGQYADPEGPPPLKEFRKFLEKAEKVKVLPSWWNPGVRLQCEKVAMNENGESFIGHAREKSDIQDDYGDSFMPMKMRMLAEIIYGKGVGMF